MVPLLIDQGISSPSDWALADDAKQQEQTNQTGDSFHRLFVKQFHLSRNFIDNIRGTLPVVSVVSLLIAFGIV